MLDHRRRLRDGGGPMVEETVVAKWQPAPAVFPPRRWSAAASAWRTASARSVAARRSVDRIASTRAFWMRLPPLGARRRGRRRRRCPVAGGARVRRWWAVRCCARAAAKYRLLLVRRLHRRHVFDLQPRRARLLARLRQRHLQRRRLAAFASASARSTAAADSAAVARPASPPLLATPSASRTSLTHRLGFSARRCLLDSVGASSAAPLRPPPSPLLLRAADCAVASATAASIARARSELATLNDRLDTATASC